MDSLFRRAKAPAPAASAPLAPMPMLCFPGKKALRFAGDTSAAERDADLAVLMHARAHVVLASESARASTAEAAAALRAYLRVVYASKIMAGPRQQKLCFAWRDAGDEDDKKKNKSKASPAAAAAVQGQGHTSLVTEWAVALFALAAELARAAAAEDRRDADGIRRACGALCDAAGALRAAATGARGSDAVDHMCHMTDACMAAFERLMLAQALECYFELAVAGGKPPALCSKIARQVSLDYQDVSVKLGSLQQQQQQPIDKSWAPHAQAKAAYFHAEANLHRARALREQGPGSVGEAVARLRFAVSVLAAAAGKTGPLGKKSPSSSSSTAAALAPVRDAAARLRREVEAELAAAENDNCQVYYERVPAADSLKELPALPEQLVRPTAVERVLREPDGEAALANGGAPTSRH
ncbi:hypothetical protein BAE44_0015910 [Dichanthelium oligosanthes]|uniref:BRO1 domain-containing protein n=1 Tax=Dichanthelium oligosanthes TaxID=888268 RepID=A0A1E5VD88_9POAL|nr:hypothetical protein BAE44_0015910 [Dichanthelium oligosanthes]